MGAGSMSFQPPAHWSPPAAYRPPRVVYPIAAALAVLLVAALYDLTRPNRRVQGDNKVVWALIIIFVATIGPILYFLAGREPE